MIFDQIVYGPLQSRRLGSSLGINLMPTNGKICSFDCIYCECGFNAPIRHPRLPTVAEFTEALEHKLNTLRQEGQRLDVITFSGNGEPTMHPDFEAIIDETVRLRNHYVPMANISVLSNATQLHKPSVIQGLMKVENRILKLDSAIQKTMVQIDEPASPHFTVEKLVEQLCAFHGELIVQTCFLRGTHKGERVDNTTAEEVKAWLAAIERIAPQSLMIYAIDRATPVKSLEKVSREELEAIADQARAKGFTVSVSG